MYSHMESDGMVIILYTEDFTLELWWYDSDDIKGEIKSSVVIINYNGNRLIRTSANVRAVTYWNSRSVTSSLLYVPYCLFHEIDNMLSVHGYYIPHSKQTKIMKLLEAVLY